MSNDRFELPLSINNQKFYYNPDRIDRRKEMLEKFIEGMYYMNSPKFAHKVLFTHELQANNTIEGLTNKDPRKGPNQLLMVFLSFLRSFELVPFLNVSISELKFLTCPTCKQCCTVRHSRNTCIIVSCSLN